MANTKSNANVIANTNANVKEEKNMANNNIITVEYETERGYNTVDAIMWYQGNCLVGAPTIDGQVHEELMVGGVNEADVKAGLAAELKMIEMAGGDIWKGMGNLRTAMVTTLHNIKPTEEVEVDGIKTMIDYGAKKIYLLDNTELANLEDIQCEMPEEAVKALLVERAKTEIATLKEEYGYEDYDDYDDEDCEW